MPWLLRAKRKPVGAPRDQSGSQPCALRLAFVSRRHHTIFVTSKIRRYRTHPHGEDHRPDEAARSIANRNGEVLNAKYCGPDLVINPFRGE